MMNIVLTLKLTSCYMHIMENLRLTSYIDYHEYRFDTETNKLLFAHHGKLYAGRSQSRWLLASVNLGDNPGVKNLL